MIYRFADSELDTARYELRCQGVRRPIEPQVFDLLLYLVENRDRTVTKDELYKAIWQGRIVSELALSSRIKRSASGSQRHRDTTRGLSAHFTAAAFGSWRLSRIGLRSEMGMVSPMKLTNASVAVLPFLNISGDPEQEYFSDGITEDLITDLSRISGLFVPARNSIFTYKGAAVKLQQICEELGVRYAVEGSVRKAGGRVRIVVQLVEEETGGHVWADRYDRDLTDVFVMQDEITHRIVELLRVRLLPNERKAIEEIPTKNLEAYQYHLRGRQFFHRKMRSSLEIAKRMFLQAIELDPNYARAHAGLADCEFRALYVRLLRRRTGTDPRCRAQRRWSSTQI